MGLGCGFCLRGLGFMALYGLFVAKEPIMTPTLQGEALKIRSTYVKSYTGLVGTWEFRKIWGTLFCGPYNKDPTI